MPSSWLRTVGVSEPPTTADSTKEYEFRFLDAALFNVDQHYLTWISINFSPLRVDPQRGSSFRVHCRSRMMTRQLRSLAVVG